MNKFKIFLAVIFLSFLIVTGSFSQDTRSSQSHTIDQRVDSVLQLMTLEEKVGQMNQYSDNGTATGPLTIDNEKERQVSQGKVGSILNALGTERARNWQKIALTSRLKIPLIFGQDVVHGYKTTFPIP